MRDDRSYSLKTISDQDGLTIVIQGRMAVENAHEILMEIQSFVNSGFAKELNIDLAQVNYFDSAGATLLLQLERSLKEKKIPLHLINPPDEIKGFLSLINKESLEKAIAWQKPKPEGIISQIGKRSFILLKDLRNQVEFTGNLVNNLLYSLVHPQKVRWSETFFYMEQVGVNALPIVSMLSFLLGLIIAFMSSVQLKQFGANVYVANLVGIGMVWELGPMMTAIIVSGRSGSAFAAEIGTMKVSEEIDALTTMGLNPIRFLVIPKALASIFVVPLLNIYSALLGILGGLVVGVLGFDITITAYINQTYKTLYMSDILRGLVKSAVFAITISGIGCMRGFQVEGGAEGVGRMTTSAVVTSIFMVIVIDSIFAIFFHYVD